jgi:asparagine synthase (glutamine-hydrolysing)
MLLNLADRGTGEGSDEHFGGYRNFLPDFFREPDPAWNGHTISDLERAELTAVKEQETQPGYKGIDQAFVTKGSSTARRMLNDTSISSCLWTVTLAHFAEWTRCYGDLDIQQSRADNPHGRILDLMNSKWHPLHTSQYVWTKSILPNLILTCMGDRMEMAHSIEGRPPFLDHILTEYINNLPPSMKIRYDPTSGEVVEKWILREASKPFITEELYKRKKHVSPNRLFRQKICSCLAFMLISSLNVSCTSSNV